MKQSNAMAHVILKLTEKFGLNMTAEYATYTFAMLGYQNLTVEKHGRDFTAVMHTAGNGALDPMIRFFSLNNHVRKSAVWFPVDIHMAFTAQTEVLAYRKNPDKPMEWAYLPKQQVDAAQFAQDWARNIRDQGWIEDAELLTQWCIEPESSFVIPVPTSPNDPSAVLTIPVPSMSLETMYSQIDCSAVEHIAMEHGWDMYINEEGKFANPPVYNPVATRLSRIDRYGDWIAGNAIITAES